MKKQVTVICLIALICLLSTGCCLKHEWKDATCTAPQTCSKCSKTQGEPLGHAWTEATCTEAAKCSVCGEIEGDPLGHDYSEWVVQKEATINSNGYRTASCNRCNDQKDDYPDPIPLKIQKDAFNADHDELAEYIENFLNDEFTAYHSVTYSSYKNDAYYYALECSGSDTLVLIVLTESKGKINNIVLMGKDNIDVLLYTGELFHMIESDISAYDVSAYLLSDDNSYEYNGLYSTFISYEGSYLASIRPED